MRKAYSSLIVVLILLSVLQAALVFNISKVEATSGTLLYSFVHLSDTQDLSQHYPSTLNYTFQWLESKKAEWNITAIIITGDLVNTYNDVQQWENYVKAKTHTTIPVYETAGNHDNNYGADFTYYNQYIGSNETFYTVNLTDQFSLIGISWNGSDNMVSSSYIQSLKEEIASHPDRYFIVATHWYMGEVDGDPTVLSSLGSLIYNELYLNYPKSLVLVLCGHVISGGVGVIISNVRGGLHEYMTDIQGANRSYVRVFKVYSNNTVTMELWRLIPSPEELVETESFELPQLGVRYHEPIAIIEQSGTSLLDYPLKIELNASNFDGWDKIAYYDGSDIYFVDESGSPLYYFVEDFDLQNRKATIWVKIPNIPASSTVTVYMYFGWENPYNAYHDPYSVFPFYDGFDTDLSRWDAYAGNVKITEGGRLRVWSPSSYIYKNLPADYYIIEFLYIFWGDNAYIRINLDNGHWVQVGLLEDEEAIKYYDGTSTQTLYTESWGVEYAFRLVHDGSTIRIYSNESLVATISGESGKINQIYIAAPDDQGDGYAGDVYVDDVRVYHRLVEPEPVVSVGEVLVATKKLRLPSETMFLLHEIAYSPNASQFTHSFTATNDTTAGYEINYADAYGWRLYANPYQSGGTGYENTASLVSEVDISLPYASVLVENVTFYARALGTGSYRQIWVRVLNSTGGVVAELANATVGTDWSEVTLTVNSNLGGQLTLWINTTVKTTATAGEEVAIKDVKVFAEYEANPAVEVAWTRGLDYFNCSASFIVELGSTDYLNSSVIIFKLIEYLSYNSTNYPVEPTYIGDEVINFYSYSVYKVEPAVYSQVMRIYALIENKLRTIRTHVKGYDTETVLVGEPLTIELPEVSNVTVIELNRTFLNITKVTLRFTSTGTFTIEANTTLTSLWKLGYGLKTVNVRYGALVAKLLDVASKEVDYEELVFQLVNKTSGAVVRELVGKRSFNLDTLWAGNYTLRAKLKDVVTCSRDFELNITTDGSIVNLVCSMLSLASDYRGYNRTVVTNYDKQLLDVKSLSTKFPYSRMDVLLNGVGTFKLLINYRGDLPTKISVVGNVSGLKYWWDGNYLVITGSLGSVGEISITDLYKLRLEIYDRLGNLMPTWMYIYINETKYSGAVAEDYLYPEVYVVKLPPTINGFEFYGFFDGYNESTRVVTINHTDVEFKAWYRVPTSIVEFKSFQITSLWLIPFIRQEGETIKIYVEGYLRDYYGNSVPNRIITLNVTCEETGYTRTYNVSTDATGYFRSPILELARGKTYKVEAIYGGDDTYVGTSSSVEIAPEKLPVAPLAPLPVEYYFIAIAVALIIAGIVAATVRAVRHTIEDMREKSRKFVKKKQ